MITPLDEDKLREAVRALAGTGIESVAVCYLFSFRNPDHERRTAEIVAEEAPGLRVSLSSDILPTIREYPRLSTTAIDAYVGPRVERYLVRLGAALEDAGIETPQLFLMQSHGGLMRIGLGARFPNQTLLSGPAAGAVSGRALGALVGRPDVGHLRHGRHLDRYRGDRRGAHRGDRFGAHRGARTSARRCCRSPPSAPAAGRSPISARTG